MLKDFEEKGIRDFLGSIPEEIVMSVANTFTKNCIDHKSLPESIETIFRHTKEFPQTLLDKKLITKEVLYKYLIQNQRVPTTEITKSNLIQEVIRFWKDRYSETKVAVIEPQKVVTQLSEEEFPINLLARSFTDWFFKSLNQNILKCEDFYADATLQLNTQANDGVDEQRTSTPNEILHTIYAVKNQFGFFFNPNITHFGVQGRMSPHGATLVLGCGTLHTLETCVGVFESALQ
uniref:Uncharacterized protein n=1 Tax=Megaselia scalaris TaxID=36166 RepID=T1GCY3_MEGSC